MNVTVVSTGGTIASTVDDDEEEGADPSLSGADLVAAVPGLEDVADIRTEDFSNVPSAHFTVSEMVELVDHLEELDDDPETDGVVITQGTDVLEETALFVERCYGGETPVVITGAMRSPSLAGPDGPANLLASVRVATATEASGMVLVAFNDRVFQPGEVTKMHSMNVDTFRAPEFGPVATVDEDRVRWVRTPDRAPVHDIDPDAATRDVHAVTVTVDMPEAQIEAAAGADAVCLAATGAGHIPPRIIDPLETLINDGTPVIATTRCPEGRLARDTYGFEGSEQTLRELGCYLSEHNLQQTRIRAIAALAGRGLDAAFERHPL